MNDIVKTDQWNNALVDYTQNLIGSDANDAYKQHVWRVHAWVQSAVPMLAGMEIDPRVYMRTILTVCINTPDLVEKCNPRTLEIAVLTSAQTGLIPNGKEAIIIPRGGSAVFQTMVAGRLRLAEAATPGLKVRCKAAYSNDELEYIEGENPEIKHKIDVFGPRLDADMRACYAIAFMPDGSREIEVMNRAELDAFRNQYASAKNGPWYQPVAFVEMCRKTLIGRVLKWLPSASAIPDDVEEFETAFDPGANGGGNTVSIPVGGSARQIEDGTKANAQGLVAAASKAVEVQETVAKTNKGGSPAKSPRAVDTGELNDEVQNLADAYLDAEDEYYGPPAGDDSDDELSLYS